MTLFVRSITSLCYAALLMVSLYVNLYFFAVVVFVMATLTLSEIHRITHQKAPAVYLFFPMALLLSFISEKIGLVLLGFGIMGVLLIANFYRSRQKIVFTKNFVTVLGLFGVSTPLILLVLLGNQNPDFVTFFFGVIWLNDTAAYLVGSSVGKRALAPSISPNKTIEGSIGGIVIATGIMMLLGSYFGVLDTVTMFTGALVTAICGGLGDLVQSKIKRQCGVKDSGKILPGHGGMYDRLDSLLFAIPLYILILVVFGYVS